MARWSTLGLAAVLGCSFSAVGQGSTDDGGDAGASSTSPSTPSSAGPNDPGPSGTAGGTGSATTGVDTAAATTTGETTVGSETGLGTTTSGPDPQTESGPSESTGSGGATAGELGCDVLFVAANDVIGGHDQPFYDVLIDLGASVTVVQDDLSTASDADGRCLVVVSASVTGSEVGGKFRDVPVPLVTWEYAIYDDMDMTGDVIETDFGPADPQENIEIADPGHPMAAGLSGTFAVVAPAPGRMSWGMPAADADVVATLPGSERATLFGYRAGDTMVGLDAPAARVGFPALTSGDGTTINADGQALFEAALLWAVD